MIFTIVLYVFLDIIGSITNISKENNIKAKAEEAFKNKDFETSTKLYSYLIDSLKVHDDRAILNLAHSQYNTKNFAEAAKTYEKMYLSKENNIKSVAAHQLGLMAFKNDNDKPKALSYYKDALRANPNNADARYNYEFLKKLIEAKQDPKMDQNKKDDQKKEDEKKQDQNQQQQQNKQGDKDQKNQDQKNKDQKGDKGKDQKDQGKNGEDQNKKGENGKEQGKNGDKKENNPSDKDDKNGSEKENKDAKQSKEEEEAKAKNDKNGQQSQNGKDAQKQGKEDENGSAQKDKKDGKQGKDKIVANPEVLAKMGMTDQRAKTLLDAMKSNEIQYIQQNKRESTKKSSGKGKPEW